MLRSAKGSLAVMRTRSQCHFCLPRWSAASTATSAFKTTRKAYSNVRGQGTSPAVESPAQLSENTGGESSHDSLPKNIKGVVDVDESVKRPVANIFRLLSPHVRARSITDRQAFLNRINAGKKQWPLPD
ncbi:hypothetical protein BFJ66_g17513 [Fusarium oxysporum f. sp. cepae]|uniref:Uncharacterized protein n=1 Tax=Fusarium oxysporum f. sp. cepae TaxID=396571 RepID=A0A3L6MTP6_FUSOX|nr:hypothetical protein BFJ65_g17792 [Fusarium oxysporum f. sp. cepae]RKK21597.1 hypothetical protein BFJ66_g17513 [Fusarium oxysporum f. sp. cepae]